MDFIIGISAFIVLWAAIEFILVIVSYDTFGENGLLSFAFTLVLALALIIIFDESEDDSTDQATQLEDQWSEEDIAEVATVQVLIDQEVEEYYNSVERPENIIYQSNDLDTPTLKTPRVIPSNRSHIDIGRRNYKTTVIYDHETREACDDIECFNVQLVQHTDGTYWACKRNWGACYEY